MTDRIECARCGESWKQVPNDPAEVDAYNRGEIHRPLAIKWARACDCLPPAPNAVTDLAEPDTFDHPHYEQEMIWCRRHQDTPDKCQHLAHTTGAIIGQLT